MLRVWSINTKNNQMLWLMGEYSCVKDAMERAESVVLDANLDVDELRFEKACVKDKRTDMVQQGVMCISKDETVGSVITGLETGDIADMETWVGCESNDSV
jgi:hypothetical protein